MVRFVWYHLFRADGKVRVWRKPHEIAMDKAQCRLMMVIPCCVFKWHELDSMVVLNTSLTDYRTLHYLATIYCSTCTFMPPQRWNVGPDGALCHLTKVVQKWLQQYSRLFRQIVWPPPLFYREYMERGREVHLHLKFCTFSE